MQPLSVSSHSLLMLLALAAGCAGLLAVWLIARAQQPARASLRIAEIPVGNVPATGIRKRLERLRKYLEELFNELRVRREWRYQVPWILCCGEGSSGKTSVVNSIRTGRNDEIGKREARLQIPGTRWTFFDSGVVIDVDRGSLPDAATDDRNWNQVLEQLNDRRPERALDGVVLVISAKTLLHGTRADVQRLAESCYAQLVSLQRHCEFQLPVYVIVSQCDSIEGFTAFWRAQPSTCRTEMFGWSNPCGLDNSYVPQWMDDAFDSMGGVMKRLLLQAAAADRPIADADEFFLAPLRFKALRESVSSVLAYVFRVSAYRAAPFFRGVYFVGEVEERKPDLLAPPPPVAFVEQLFSEKIFAEQNLARPLRHAVWSRNVLIRRLQYGAVALTFVLCVSLFNACVQLSRQMEVGAVSVDLIRRPQHAGMGSDGCVSKASVYELLSNISLLDVRVTSLAIPASWIDRRIENGGLHLVANAAFERLIFPAFACELERQARRVVSNETLVHTPGDSLSSDRSRLRQYLDQVIAFERNRSHFAELAAYASIQRADVLEADMEALALYLYGDPLPGSVHNSRGYHRNALARSVYRNPLRLPPSMHAQVEQILAQWSARGRDEISGEIDAGAALLDAMAAERPPLLENTQRFDRWLQRMRTEWMAATPENNPCAKLADLLRPQLTELSSQYGYSKNLPAVADDFSAASCYEPAMRHLTGLHIAPQGVLFVKQADQWQLAPALAAEADGLADVVSLDVMQVAPARPFSCQQPVRGWRIENLQEAARYAREYESFTSARHLDDSQEAPPLYVRVLRRQLQSVLDESMRNAQLTDLAATLQTVDSVDSMAASEQALAQQSSDLLRIYPSLLWILGQYQQMKFDSTTRIVQCVRRYAADALQRLSSLAQASGLYEVPLADADSDTDGLFSLGAAPEIKDYLQGQFQRAQVLASYAGPFVSVLQNTDGSGEPAAPPGAGPAYWDNTRQEVNRVLQFKDTGAQATLLGDFIVKQLAALTTDNCQDKLAAYTPPAYGNDLFSRRRQALETAAEWNCRDEEKAAAIAQYQVWANRFGSDLAGKFPFAGLGAPADASLLVTHSFFVDYNAARDSLRKKLSWLKARGLGEVAQFLDGLDGAARFFGGASTGTDVLPPLHLKLEFRALAPQSTGAENIISWNLQTREATASYPNGQTEMDWRYGEPVKVVITWAALSPVAPQSDPQQTDMRVDGNAVSFQADGPWALLKLILQHVPDGGVSTAALGPGTALLQFQIPTQDKQHSRTMTSSRIFMAIRLSVPDPKTQAAVPLAWPGRFAAYAPRVW